MRTTAFAACFLALADLAGTCTAQAGPQAVDPVFVAGDLATLDVRIVDVRPTMNAGTLLVVEVTNRGAVDAEPLSFRIATKDRKAPLATETFNRGQLPRMQRYGRPTPAGGKETYTLRTSLQGKRPQLAVDVVAATWHENGRLARPAVRVGKPQQVQRESLVGTFPVTQFDVTNPLDTDVDLLFAVTFTQPRDGVELVGLRLAAGATRTWVFGSVPSTANCFDDVDIPPGCAMKATTCELVDWCVVGPADPDAAATLLQTAYDAWLRWPDAATEVSGQFRFVERRRDPNDDAKFVVAEVTGRFTQPAHGDLVVKIESGADANPHSSIQAALANLRRPDFATLARDNRLRRVEADRVQIDGRGFDPNRAQGATTTTAGSGQQDASATDYRVRDGHIVADYFGGSWETVWDTRDVDGGWLLARLKSDSYDTTFRYAQEGGRYVPTGSTRTTTFGERLFSTEELQLSGLRFDGAGRVTPAAPAGDGAAALQTIWAAGYHVPVEPLPWSASFEVTQPNTDWVWRGQKKIRGRFTAAGFGRSATSMQFTFDGNLSPEIELGLAEAFRDRLGMWYGRDFADRVDFAAQFAGATIHAPKADGSFAVDDCWITRVLTADGLVVGYDIVGGGTYRFTYQKLGDRAVVSRIVCDAEAGPGVRDRKPGVVGLTWTKVGDVLLPTQIQLEHIFGDDWGPETLVMKNVKLQ